MIEGNDAVKFIEQFQETNEKLNENPELRDLAKKKAFEIKFNEKHKKYWFDFVVGFVVGVILSPIVMVFVKFA